MPFVFAPKAQQSNEVIKHHTHEENIKKSDTFYPSQLRIWHGATVAWPNLWLAAFYQIKESG